MYITITFNLIIYSFCLFFYQINHIVGEIDRIVHQIDHIVHDLVELIPHDMFFIANKTLDDIGRIWLLMQHKGFNAIQRKECNARGGRS